MKFFIFHFIFATLHLKQVRFTSSAAQFTDQRQIPSEYKDIDIFLLSADTYYFKNIAPERNYPHDTNIYIRTDSK